MAGNYAGDPGGGGYDVGGGFAAMGGVTTFVRTKIYSNRAKHSAGALSLNGAQMAMYDSEIFDNEAQNNGVMSTYGSIVAAFYNVVIRNNLADRFGHLLHCRRFGCVAG